MATRLTAAKPAEKTPRKRATNKTGKAIPEKIFVSIKDLLTTLLKSHGIKEGYWILDVKTGSGTIQATKIDNEKTNAFPATLVVLEGVNLVPVNSTAKILESENTVDAGKI